MLRAWLRKFSLIPLMLVLSACLSVPPAPPNDIQSPNAGLIYGYVEANNDFIERVDFLEFGRVYIPPFNHPPQVLVYDNGMFMAENIMPGKYVIGGFRSDKNHYNLTRSTRKSYQRIIHVRPGTINYVGSFQIRVTRRGQLDFGDFKVTPIQRPGERDVLKHLYGVTEGTGWQNKIVRRMKELRQF